MTTEHAQRLARARQLISQHGASIPGRELVILALIAEFNLTDQQALYLFNQAKKEAPQALCP